MNSQTCPPPANLIQQGGFESCQVPPGVTQNAAINAGCVPGWVAGNGTPSVCNNIVAGIGGPIVSAPEGVVFACISSSLLSDGGCNENEAIFQNLNLCLGATYQLTFSYYNLFGLPGTIGVALTHGLTNVPASDDGNPCFNDNAPGQPDIPDIQVPVGAGTWVTTTTTFTVDNTTDNQLVFWASPALPGTAFNVGLDNIILTCVESALIPQINWQYAGGGEYNFNGSITNPSGTSVSDWCWDFGDGSMVEHGQNVTHNYAAAGTYEVILTITDECGCQNTARQTIVYDACDCSNQPQVLGPGQISWSGLTQTIGNDVIIPPGTQLTISNSILSMKSTCKFVVMRGARLNIEQVSILQPLCEGERWEGIVVWGNNAAHTSAQENAPLSSADPGVLKITRNSTLRGARIAVQAQRWWGDRAANEEVYEDFGFIKNDPNNQAFRGGFVIADNSYFRNNRKSGEFSRFEAPSLSRFVNGCEFTCDLPNCNGLEGVTIWDTDGILFDNCTFDNVKARDIVILDGSTTVKGSDFFNNVDGIEAGTTAIASGDIIIGLFGDGASANNFLYNTGSGIYSKGGVSNLKVNENIFRLNGKGIYLRMPSANVEIATNTFTDHTNALTATAATIFENTGPGSVKLYECNIFEQNDYGITATQNNDGLTFRDNAFNNTLADLRLRSKSVPGSIRLLQGLQGAPVWNLFSENEQINDVETDQQSSIFYYYPPLYNPNPAAQARLIPDCDINDPCLTNYNFQNQPLQPANYPGCLDLERNGEPPAPESPCQTLACLQQLETDIAALQQVINSGGSSVENNGLLQKIQVKLYRDKRLLVWQWRKDGNMADIYTLLNGSSDYEDQKLYYSVKLKNGDLAGAAALLNAMPESTQDQIWFKSVQEINLDFRSATAPYALTPQQDSVLRVVAQGGTSAGASATGLLYLLTGEWVDDKEEEELGGRGSEERNRAVQLKSNAFRVYPNPAQDYVSIEFDEAEGLFVALVDITGRTVLSQPLSGSPHTLPLNGLPNGIFALRLTDNQDNTAYFSRLVISH